MENIKKAKTTDLIKEILNRKCEYVKIFADYERGYIELKLDLSFIEVSDLITK